MSQASTPTDNGISDQTAQDAEKTEVDRNSIVYRVQEILAASGFTV